MYNQIHFLVLWHSFECIFPRTDLSIYILRNYMEVYYVYTVQKRSEQ